MSAQLPQFTPAQVIAGFERAGWSVLPHRGKGHTIMSKAGEPALLSIPNHREVKRGLLRSLIRIAGLSVADFNRLASL